MIQKVQTKNAISNATAGIPMNYTAGNRQRRTQRLGDEEVEMPADVQGPHVQPPVSADAPVDKMVLMEQQESSLNERDRTDE